MSEEIDLRLAAMGIVLTGYREPASRYRPAIRTGNLLYFSGQLSAMQYGEEITGITGKLGSEINVERGRAAARLAAIGLLVRATGYINSAPGFDLQHSVLDGCSEELIGALGERGTHTRLAIGIAGLSFNTSVEVDCIMEVEP